MRTGNRPERKNMPAGKPRAVSAATRIRAGMSLLSGT